MFPTCLHLTHPACPLIVSISCSRSAGESVSSGSVLKPAVLDFYPAAFSETTLMRDLPLVRFLLLMDDSVPALRVLSVSVSAMHLVVLLRTRICASDTRACVVL